MPSARDFDAWVGSVTYGPNRVMPVLVGMRRNPPNLRLWPFKGGCGL